VIVTAAAAAGTDAACDKRRDDSPMRRINTAIDHE